MPHVHITWAARDTETKRQVAKRITEVLVEEAKCPASAVHIAFLDNPRENFANGGVLLVDEKEQH